MITYAALIGAIALGSALAFGLGGRDVAAQMLQGAYQKSQEQKEQVREDLARGRERATEQLSQAREMVQERAQESAPAPPGSRTIR